LALLAGCGGPPSETVTVCLEKETTIELRAMPKVGGGIPLGGGLEMRPMPVTRCVKSETRPNPRYAEWLAAQERVGKNERRHEQNETSRLSGQAPNVR